MAFFMIDLMTTDILPEERTLLMHPSVGMVILFARNFQNASQLRRLTAEIHQLRPEIIVATDHEGGEVQRFHRSGFCALPPAAVYGEVFDRHPETAIDLAKTYGHRMATDLLRHGVDLSFAPVLDLHLAESTVIGGLNRAFHADPKAVVALAGAWIEGMRAAGMPAVGKHFPGHGRVHSDSHLQQPIYEGTREALEVDLYPFKYLIAQKQLAAVMPGHVKYPVLDAEHAAGFSKVCLQALLRQQYQFQGLIISDCLSMAGADIGSLHERCQAAAEAGCDVLTICNQPREVLASLLAEHGPSDEATVERLAAFRQQMGRFSGHQAAVIADDMAEISVGVENSLNRTLSV